MQRAMSEWLSHYVQAMQALSARVARGDFGPPDGPGLAGLQAQLARVEALAGDPAALVTALREAGLGRMKGSADPASLAQEQAMLDVLDAIASDDGSPEALGHFTRVQRAWSHTTVWIQQQRIESVIATFPTDRGPCAASGIAHPQMADVVLMLADSLHRIDGLGGLGAVPEGCRLAPPSDAVGARAWCRDRMDALRGVSPDEVDVDVVAALDELLAALDGDDGSPARWTAFWSAYARHIRAVSARRGSGALGEV